MDKQELDKAVEQLRSTLNNGNHVTRIEPHTDTIGNVSSSTAKKRRNRKELRSDDAENVGSSRPSDGSNTGTTTGVGTAKPNSDRPSESNSSIDVPRSDVTNVTPRSRGRLIRDDDIPTRKEKNQEKDSIGSFKIPHRQPGRPKKQEEVKADRTTAFSTIQNTVRERKQDASDSFKNFFKTDQKPLTGQEAEDLTPKVAAIFLDYGTYFDSYINYKAQTHTKYFGDLSQDEAEVLSRVVLRLGKRDARVATAVRTMADGSDYLSAIIILWPRIMKVVDALRPEPLPKPVKEKKPFVQRNSLFNKVHFEGVAKE